MTIDEAIKHCNEVVEKNEQAKKDNNLWIDTEYEDCCTDHRQLAEWLTELKELRSLKTDYVFFKAEAKKLLKAVVKDMNATVAEVYNGGLLCKCCKWKSRTGECCCPGDGGCDVAYQWRYVDEAEKLLNDEK